MKARLLLAAILAGNALSLSAAPARADEGWVIKSFHSQIAIDPETSALDVTENIQVDFGSLRKHGIFRNIPVRYRYDSTRDRYYDLEVESVTDGLNKIAYTSYDQGPIG